MRQVGFTVGRVRTVAPTLHVMRHGRHVRTASPA